MGWGGRAASGGDEKKYFRMGSERHPSRSVSKQRETDGEKTKRGYRRAVAPGNVVEGSLHERDGVQPRQPS